MQALGCGCLYRRRRRRWNVALRRALLLLLGDVPRTWRLPCTLPLLLYPTRGARRAAPVLLLLLRRLHRVGKGMRSRSWGGGVRDRWRGRARERGIRAVRHSGLLRSEQQIRIAVTAAGDVIQHHPRRHCQLVLTSVCAQRGW